MATGRGARAEKKLIAQAHRDLRPKPAVAGLPYEQRLDEDPRWALGEGSMFFEGKGAVQEAMSRIARRLDEKGILYAVVGGMASFMPSSGEWRSSGTAFVGSRKTWISW